MSIIESVTNLHEREKRIRDLCCLMLATLILKDNQPAMPEKLRECADDWEEQYNNIMDFHPIEAESEALKDGLQKYGSHKKTCYRIVHDHAPWSKCDCGFDALLT